MVFEQFVTLWPLENSALRAVASYWIQLFKILRITRCLDLCRLFPSLAGTAGCVSVEWARVVGCLRNLFP